MIVGNFLNQVIHQFIYVAQNGDIDFIKRLVNHVQNPKTLKIYYFWARTRFLLLKMIIKVNYGLKTVFMCLSTIN